jgi:hypothetical protein
VLQNVIILIHERLGGEGLKNVEQRNLGKVRTPSNAYGPLSNSLCEACPQPLTFLLKVSATTPRVSFDIGQTRLH